MAHPRKDVGVLKDHKVLDAWIDVVEPFRHLERISRLSRDETWLLFFVGILDILERGQVMVTSNQSSVMLERQQPRAIVERSYKRVGAH